MQNSILKFLFSPTNPVIVSLFRICFGAFMMHQMLYYFSFDYTYQFMSGPQVLFPYESFTFIKPLSTHTLRLIHFGLLISAFLILIGFLYRYAIILFFLGFTYFFLIDKTLYNNHLYLICLISFVLIFINADKNYSVKSLLSKKKSLTYIPAWNQYILAFLIALPYFFGGIAKLSYNWLGTDLPRIIVEQSKGNFLFNLLSKNLTTQFVTYTGLVFDLLIVFILLNKKTRYIGVVLVIFFNLSNHSILFDDIGLFPFLMIVSTILFFDPEKVYKLLNVFKSKKIETTTKKNKQKGSVSTNSKINTSLDETTSLNKWTLKKKFIAGSLTLFISFHLLFPLRHFLYTDNPEWTGIASRFAWRMKMQNKEITHFSMTFANRTTGDSAPIEVTTFLTKNQLLHLADDPKNYVQLAKFLSERIEKETQLKDPKITANVEVRFNGLKSQYFFDPAIDLVNIKETLLQNGTWLNPLKKD